MQGFLQQFFPSVLLEVDHERAQPGAYFEHQSNARYSLSICGIVCLAGSEEHVLPVGEHSCCIPTVL